MANWSNLQEELLLLIFSKLYLSDLLRSSAVCISWFSAADELRRQRLSPRPHRAPCLIFCDSGSDSSSSSTGSAGEIKSYSLAEKRFHAIPHSGDPLFRNPIFIGSSHGWPVVADERSELYLVEPFTGDRVALPPVSSLPCVQKLRDTKESSCLSAYPWAPRAIVPENLRYLVYRKAVLSSSPYESNCAVVMLEVTGRLNFAGARSSKWIAIEPPVAVDGYRDINFHKDKLYAMDCHGTIEVWNPAGPSLEASFFITPQLNIPLGMQYLVFSPSGDLFLVWVDIEELEWSATCQFEVYKAVDGGLGEHSVVAEKNLGNYALFVGANHSMCLSCTDFPELCPNCIYFADNNLVFFELYENKSRDLFIYNLEDESSHSVCAHDPSRLHLHWPMPIWMTSTLT